MELFIGLCVGVMIGGCTAYVINTAIECHRVNKSIKELSKKLEADIKYFDDLLK